ncbi:MAG: peptide ABC transporter substrate-binding protein [bacterium]|nr:peptide ABC transporter substrate-binding protein [bacterium]
MYNQEKTILGFLSILLVASLSLSITGYVQRHSTLVAQDGGTYTEAIVGQPRYINPVLASTNDADMDLTKVVYSSLFRLGTDLSLQNDLATSVETSSDGKTYTIQMREDATWHDGRKVTPDDVVFTIESIQSKDHNSPIAPTFQGVGVQKVDDKTVRFTLQKTAYAPFISSLTVGILPKHVWENIPAKTANFAEQQLRPVGSGPFKFEKIVTKKKTGEITSISFIRNEEYYGQKAHLSTLAFNFVNTHEEAISALTSNKVDGIGHLPSSLVSSVENRSAIQIKKLLLPQYFGLFLNQVKNQILNDAGVRSALDLAIDRNDIVTQALGGQGEPLGIPIPSGIFSFPDIRDNVFDIEKAKQNLDDAGWRVGEHDGIREKDGKQLEVTITTTDWQEYIKTAELIKEKWSAIGVKTNIQSLSTAVIQQIAVIPRQYEILLYGESLPVNPDPYPFWHSSQIKSPGLNLSLVQDKDIDKLLENARISTDQEKRKELLQSFIERFLDIHPAIVLYRPYYLFAQHTQVKGANIEKGGLPSDRFNNIEKWHVREKRLWNT